MVHRDGPVGGADGAIEVAIIEQREETLHQVVALAAQSLRLDIQVLHDTADYLVSYGASNGPNVLLVGLDENPQAALAAAKGVVAMAPFCGIVVYGRNVTMELLQQAMTSGARRYVPYPFDADALRNAVTGVYAEMKPLAESARAIGPARDDAGTAGPGEPEQKRDPKVTAVFSPKGGVGTSTLAVNLACALSTMRRRVVIVDGNISFGNVGVFLNIPPSKNMLELAGDPSSLQDGMVESVLVPHLSGIKVMLAPLKPEEGDSIQGDHLRAIIASLKHSFDHIVVDTWPSYDERVLAMLEVADQILVPTGPELPSVKNLASFLRVARLLGYPQEKLTPVLMRANSVSPGHLRDIESFLNQPLLWRVVSDGKRVTESVNNGEPFVLTDPDAPVSQNVFDLARMVDGAVTDEVKAPAERKGSSWRLPRFSISKAS